MSDFKPTRSELLALKKKINFMEKGHDLLRKRRDSLVMNFFSALDDAKRARLVLEEKMKNSEKKLAMAMAVDGALSLRSAAFARSGKPVVDVKRKNMTGVIVPQLSCKNVKRRIHERGYGVIGMSNRIDEAVNSYEELVEAIIHTAEKEAVLRKLLDAIEGTRRRVNALEFKVLPELRQAESNITMRLEEMERENIFRLKRFKRLSE